MRYHLNTWLMIKTPLILIIALCAMLAFLGPVRPSEPQEMALLLSADDGSQSGWVLVDGDVGPMCTSSGLGLYMNKNWGGYTILEWKCIGANQQDSFVNYHKQAKDWLPDKINGPQR